jgi:hypothetical protein
MQLHYTAYVGSAIRYFPQKRVLTIAEFEVESSHICMGHAMEYVVVESAVDCCGQSLVACSLSHTSGCPERQTAMICAFATSSSQVAVTELPFLQCTYMLVGPGAHERACEYIAT